MQCMWDQKQEEGRALLGVKVEHKKSKKTNNDNTGSNTSKLGDSLKRELLGLGREVVMQRSSVEELRQRRKLGEEEQAAVLLMALSCGSVYALPF
ncbi:GATA transcription factor 15 [Camellia lanceoleosa]|uniref:GATA transcription factor 15 n=1 Tax=Camellia lanceoleosa TaxID=1840588 RepID=A0ACC0J4Y3_9ERIC|nr:GATA transcription factor 15 [Camellia lanceoleosa]